VDPLGEYVAAANYRSGDVALLPVAADGRVEPACELVRHSGDGPVKDRQAGPHAHSANFDASGRFLIAADLGIDRLMVYALDRERGKLYSHVPGGVVVEPGSGPRHFTFHPTQTWAYLINELGNTVVAYRWDAENGCLTPLQTVSTLPATFTGESTCAEIRVHPSGRFVYGSNRGHDSLAIFRLDPATGLLEPAGHVSTGGEHPRHFTISPDGNWLLAANMHSDNIVVFRIGDDGGLQAEGEPVSIPSPTCLLFTRD
jgi:6-phosphogluconolactonase